MLTIRDAIMRCAMAAPTVRERLVLCRAGFVRHGRLEPLPSRPLVVVAVALAAGCVAARGVSALGVMRPHVSAAILWWLAAGVSLGLWSWGRCANVGRYLCWGNVRSGEQA